MGLSIQSLGVWKEILPVYSPGSGVVTRTCIYPVQAAFRIRERKGNPLHANARLRDACCISFRPAFAVTSVEGRTLNLGLSMAVTFSILYGKRRLSFCPQLCALLTGCESQNYPETSAKAGCAVGLWRGQSSLLDILDIGLLPRSPIHRSASSVSDPPCRNIIFHGKHRPNVYSILCRQALSDF